jgi:hypothetical protein
VRDTTAGSFHLARGEKSAQSGARSDQTRGLEALRDITLIAMGQTSVRFQALLSGSRGGVKKALLSSTDQNCHSATPAA